MACDDQELGVDGSSGLYLPKGNCQLSVSPWVDHNAIDGWKIWSFIWQELLFLQSFFSKRLAYMISQELLLLIRIRNTSSWLWLSLSPKEISHSRFLPPSHYPKNLRAGLYGLAYEVFPSFLLTVINLEVLLFIMPLENMLDLGAPNYKGDIFMLALVSFSFFVTRFFTFPLPWPRLSS